MENKSFENLIKTDDAFDTQKLLADVDLSDVTADIDIEEILAEYGHHSRVAVPEGDESWINEGYIPKPVQTKEEKKKEPPEDGSFVWVCVSARSRCKSIRPASPGRRERR